MNIPKKIHKKRYNIVLKEDSRLIVEKASKETELSMSEIIEFCILYTNENFKWIVKQ